MADVVLKPTVVIGLGGSGYETVLNLKTRFVEAFGEVPPAIAFLAFDTAQNPNAVRRTRRGEKVVLNQGEFVKIAVDNPHRFIQTNPAIQAWFPTGLDSLAIIAGAGMVRARGRLAFYYKFREYQQAIDAAKNRVRLLDNEVGGATLSEGYTVAEASEVNIFICSSVCGGTGAGTFIDTAWLARDGMGTAGQVNAVLFMPRIFKANVKPSHLMLKNAYSALKELDHWMSGPTPGTVDYGVARLNIHRSPFDLVYLLDGFNRDNKVIADLPQLYGFAAEAMFLMIGSQVGQAGENTLDNVFTDLSARPTVKGKKAIYCSFGVGRLSYPIRQATDLAIAHAAVRLGREELLNGLANEAQLEADVTSFFVRHGLDAEGTNQVVDHLVRLPDGAAFAPVVNLADVDADRAAATNARQYGEHRQNAVLTELQRHLERNSRELLDRSLAAFDAHFSHALESRSNGLSYTYNFANKLQARLETARQTVVSEATEYATRLERVNAVGALAAVEQAAKRRLLNRQHQRDMIAEYATTLTTECQLKLEIERRTRAAQVFVRLSDRVKDLTQKLEAGRSVCRAVLEDLERRLDHARAGRRAHGGFERRIQTPDPAPGVVNVTAVEFLALKSGQMIDWTFKDRERLGRELWDYVAERVQKVMEPHLERVTTAPELTGMLHELDGVSRPLWQYERAELPPQTSDTVTFYIYGVEDKDNTLLRRPDIANQLPAGQGKPTIVGTNDPETIYQLQIEAGLPLFALKDLQRWKEEYDNPELLTGHVMEGAKQFAEILPDLGKSETLRIFALAVSDVFGLITQETKGGLSAPAEIRYVTVRRQGLREETVHLGDGRLAAFRTFSVDETLIQEMAARIEQRQASMSQDELLDKLQVHYHALDDKRQNANWPFQVRAHIEQELNAIDEYVDELSTVALRV